MSRIDSDARKGPRGHAAGDGATAKQAEAGLDLFVGEITVIGFTFCPTGYAEANGQLLQISSNAALYSF